MAGDNKDELAAAILQAWRHFREASGIKTNFIILALGGRKDGAANPNSLLQPGAWGVDVVETEDSAEFLKAVNWNNLKEGRPLDAVFEIYNHPR